MDISKGDQDMNIDEMKVQAEENEKEDLQRGFASSESKDQAEENKKEVLQGGFTLSGDGDIMCSACYIQVKGAFANMDEGRFLDMHFMISPFCPIAKGIVKRQKEAAEKEQSKKEDAIPPKEETQQSDALPENTSGEPQESSGFFHPKALHPSHCDRTTRERSFYGYNGPIDRDHFIDAGFYLNRPPDDKTTCFWCDGSLEGWNEGEKPREEHAKYYPGCGYLRQLLGPDEIYSIRAQMSTLERESAENLRYGYDKAVVFEYYRAYKDINTRIRSLVVGGFTDDVAGSLAVQGFHFNDEQKTVQCYYCGMHVNKKAKLADISESHRRTSTLCKMVKRDGDYFHPPASQGDEEEYLVCEPCGCFIIASEYDPDTALCPKLNCRAGVKRIKPFSTRRLR